MTAVLAARPFSTVDPQITIATVEEATPTVVTIQASVDMQGSTGFDTNLMGATVVSQVVQGGNQSLIDLTLSRRVYIDDGQFTVTYTPGDFTDQRVPPIALRATNIQASNNTTIHSSGPLLVPASCYVHAQEPTIVVLHFDEDVTVTNSTDLAVYLDGGSPADTIVGVSDYEGDSRKIRVQITTSVASSPLPVVTVDIGASNTIFDTASPTHRAQPVSGQTIQTLGF